ncbi:hypothetical protein HPB48_010969 [Haemaphysalis longicornis]|uniref:Uncharacterized protein n=1 Tax=Haemaphysalis longicornis TaxID=44386 RepID=A0A9J6GQ55_HAELO|nr:hypothetical protein HPB48_010969 [Haemaphysalis longicornis]
MISRILYQLPYMHITNTQTNAQDAMLRKAYRAALLLPPGAPTNRLMSLGIHNTIPELLEAHRTAQLARLFTTATGHFILQITGHTPLTTSTTPQPIPRNIRALIRIKPLPRHMHPIFHANRRAARASHHAKLHPLPNTPCT